MKTFKTPKGTELPMLSLKGKDYIQVAHRLVWFREEMPDARIETSFIEIEDQYAIARAVVSTSDGKILGTATKKEDAKHFPDFIEKAETGAIGRALALCGFGTQFAPELDEEHRIVDSPLTPKNGEYVIPFGKFKGQTILEAGIDECLNYASWLHQDIKTKGKEPDEKTNEFFAELKKIRIQKGD
jgi:hypothetical protein